MKKRLIKSLLVKEGNSTHVDVTLEYNIGGYNYFTGKMTARGLDISVTPLTKTSMSTSYIGFSGVYKHVLDMKRFNAKTLETFVPDEKIIEELVNHVVEKNNLKLAE